MFTNNLCQAAEKKKGSHFKPFDKDKFITRDFKAKRIFLFEWSYPQKNRRHCSFSNEPLLDGILTKPKILNQTKTNLN